MLKIQTVSFFFNHAEFVIVSLANSLRYHAMEKVSFLVYRFFCQLCAKQCYTVKTCQPCQLLAGNMWWSGGEALSGQIRTLSALRSY